MQAYVRVKHAVIEKVDDDLEDIDQSTHLAGAAFFRRVGLSEAWRLDGITL